MHLPLALVLGTAALPPATASPAAPYEVRLATAELGQGSQGQAPSEEPPERTPRAAARGGRGAAELRALVVKRRPPRGGGPEGEASASTAHLPASGRRLQDDLERCPEFDVSEQWLVDWVLANFWDIFSPYNCTLISRLEFTGGVTDLSGFADISRMVSVHDLVIDGTQLVTLHGLEGLSSINYLRVVRNDALVSLSGLNVQRVPYKVFIESNGALESLAGLDQLRYVGGLSVRWNDRLSSIASLRSLEVVEFHGLTINSNPALTSLHGLQGLRQITGYLTIMDNSLVSMNGLDSLSEVFGNILIMNPGLQTLQGLNALHFAGIIRIRSSGTSRMKVLGGLFSDSVGGNFKGLDFDQKAWPLCITPQERTSLVAITGRQAGLLEAPEHLISVPEATWESWLQNSCGPDLQVCWLQMPCLIDLTTAGVVNSSVSLPAAGRTCGPCRPGLPRASVAADRTVDVAGLLSGQDPGSYTLCRCRPGPSGAGPAAQVQLLGPRLGQNFSCTAGCACSLGVAGEGLRVGDAVSVMYQCNGDEVPGGLAERDAGGAHHFEGGGPPPRLPPGRYPLCWRPSCGGAGGADCRQVQIGVLEVLGPFARNETPAAVGQTLEVANVGTGVRSTDRLRLLRECGVPSLDGLESQSTGTMIFAMELNAQSIRARRYRKCWCQRQGNTTCSDPRDFRVDTGELQVVCPPGQEPTREDECRACPVGRKKQEASIEGCTIDSVYVVCLALYSLLLSLAFVLLLVLLRRPIRIEDVRVMGGRTIVKTLRPHYLQMYGGGSFVVRFHGTAHPGLDHPREPFRAQVSSSEGLALLGPGGLPVSGRLDTSTGFVSLPWLAELAHRGWPAPVALAAPLLALAAGAVHIVQRQRLDHSALGAAAALAVALAARGERLLPRRSQLDHRIEQYRQLLLQENPQPAPCEKGPGRAIQIGQLLKFMEFFRGFVQDRDAYYLVGNILHPLTKPRQLSYAELVGPSEVEWFVSHSWGDAFAHFCKAVQKHAESVRGPDTWQQTAYWICFCSNNQHKIKQELGTTWSESSFFLTLQSGLCRGVCMVLDDLATPLTRAWCIFELLQVLKLERSSEESGAGFEGLLLCTDGGILNSGQGSIEVAMNLVRQIASLDLGKASASVEEDKVMIHEQVVREMGSFGVMNELVREKMYDILAKARIHANCSFDKLFELLDSKGGSAAGSNAARSCTAAKSEAPLPSPPASMTYTL